MSIRNQEEEINKLLAKITRVRIETHYIGRNQYRIDLVPVATIAIVPKTKIEEKLGEIYQIVKAIVENKIDQKEL